MFSRKPETTFHTNYDDTVYTLCYRHLKMVEYVSGLFVHFSGGYISYTNNAVKAHYWFDIVPSQFLQRIPSSSKIV